MGKPRTVDSTKNCCFTCILVFFPPKIAQNRCCTKIDLECLHSCLIKPMGFLNERKPILKLKNITNPKFQ